MADQTESYAYFFVVNFDCDHSDITQQLGFEPTEARNRRDASGAEYVSMWRYLLRSQNGESRASDGVASLLSTLELHANSIAAISEQYHTGITCVGRFGIELAPDLLQRISQLRVRFDFACVCTFAGLGD